MDVFGLGEVDHVEGEDHGVSKFDNLEDEPKVSFEGGSIDHADGDAGSCGVLDITAEEF